MTGTSVLPKSLRYWLAQSLISLIAIVVALLLLEFGFRVARRGTVSMDRLEWRDNRQPAAANKVYEKSQEFEFTATLNQDGFRGPPVGFKKPTETCRLLILGDSFIFGWGVNDDQTFAHILERAINRHGKQLEILNAAGGSLSPLVYYAQEKAFRIRS